MKILVRLSFVLLLTMGGNVFAADCECAIGSRGQEPVGNVKVLTAGDGNKVCFQEYKNVRCVDPQDPIDGSGNSCEPTDIEYTNEKGVKVRIADGNKGEWMDDILPNFDVEVECPKTAPKRERDRIRRVYGN